MEYNITVQEAVALPDAVFRVAVVSSADGEVQSEHTVRAEEAYVTALGWESTEVNDLIRQSFQFLLERESPAAILKEFNLRVIATYFPEYEEMIGKKK